MICSTALSHLGDVQPARRARRRGYVWPLLVVILLLACPAAAQRAVGEDGETMAETIVSAAADSSRFRGTVLDSTSAAAFTDSLSALLEVGPENLPEVLPEIEPVNLWSTGASPAGAVLMSPLFPGWGQLYAENGWRGALAYGSQMWFWSRMLTRDRRAVRAREFANTFESDSANYDLYNAIAEENWEQMRDYAWWSGAAMLIISLDAYVGAHLFHFDDDPVPVPNRWDDIFDPPGGGMPGSMAAPSVVVMSWSTRF
jgi:Family of unknown function (DUF5683)